MNIYFRLDDLANTSELPSIVNVHARVSQTPFKSDEGGGKWLMDVVSPSGNSTAIVSVLIAPDQSGITLPYDTTSQELLAIFETKRLRELFQPGEEVLVQAVPRRGVRNGETVLYLNVPVIAIARPSHLFGRTVIDFASPCERRTFLSISKAVRKPKTRRSGFVSAILGGQIGHDLVSAFAVGNLSNNFKFDSDLLEHVTDDTLSAMVWLGLSSDSDTDISIACRRGIKSLELVANSTEISDLFQSDKDWVAESDALNNGVNASPDLLARRSVVELKQVDTNSEKYDEQRMLRQVEGYLAWAMVEYGVENVCSNWTGYLLNIHEKTLEGERVIKSKPKTQLIGWRLHNRHKQLGSTTGDWLPSPNEGECEHCDFARPTLSLEHLPAPCTYYCQTERHWSCIDEKRECPLLGVCDQNDNYEPYERLDSFNRLRQELLEEEEEQETIRQVVRMLDGSSQSSLVLLTGFLFDSQNGTRVRLKIPREISNLTFAQFGELYAALIGNTNIGRWKFLKRKRDLLVFETGSAKPIARDAILSLRPEPGGRVQVRDQLASIDIDQRSGDRPFSLMQGATRDSEVQVREWVALDTVPDDASFILVNAFEPNRVQAAVKQLINKRFMDCERILVISQNYDLGAGVANVNSNSLRSRMEASDSMLTSVLELVKSLRESRVIVAGFEELTSGQIARVVDGRGKFDAIVVLGAEELPVLLVSKCIEASKVVVLVGNRECTGPRTETADRPGSILSENPIRYLAEVGPAILPEPISTLDIVDLPIVGAPMSLKDFPNFRNQIQSNIPVKVNIVEPAKFASQEYFSLSGRARNSNGRSFSIDLDLAGLPKIPMGQARQLMKSLNPLALERLSPDINGKLDSSILGFAARVVGRTVENSDEPHSVSLRIPVSEFRYIEEFHLASHNEVDAILKRKNEINDDCVACSPFIGQCVALASRVAESGTLLPVYTTSTLITTHFSLSSVLLVSLVANQGRFPHPLDDPRSILPVLAGSWKRIEFFCSQHVAENYPLLRILQNGG